MKQTICAAAAALAMALAPAWAHATVTFQLELIGLPGGFTATLPDFPTSEVDLTAADLDSCQSWDGVDCGPVKIYPFAPAFFGFGVDASDVLDMGSPGFDFFFNFPDGTFSHDGVTVQESSWIDPSGQLTISSSTPEPQTWLLMILGAGLTGQTLRRHRAKSLA